MHTNLEQDRSNFESLLENTLHVSIQYLNSIETRPPATAFSKKEMFGLPEDGLASSQTLELFLERYGRDMPSSNGPRFWGLVTGGTTPAALMGDWLTSVYDLNLSHAANSIAPNIEMEYLLNNLG